MLPKRKSKLRHLDRLSAAGVPMAKDQANSIHKILYYPNINKLLSKF